MANKQGNQRETRYRYYATIVYAESAPDIWMDVLRAQMVPAFVSPYHDSDTNPDGTPKKAHWHVLLLFEGMKTKEQAETVIKAFGGVGCETVQSLRGYARYLCHLDNPDKFQYNSEDVVSICGADYIDAVNLPTDKYRALREMMDFCIENGIYNFADLAEYAAMNRPDWFRIICDNGTVFIKEYLKSKAYGMAHRRPVSSCKSPSDVGQGHHKDADGGSIAEGPDGTEKV